MSEDHADGHRIYVVTNQSGISRGELTGDEACSGPSPQPSLSPKLPVASKRPYCSTCRWDDEVFARAGQLGLFGLFPPRTSNCAHALSATLRHELTTNVLVRGLQIT